MLFAEIDLVPAANFRAVQVASAGGRNDVFSWFQRFMRFETPKPYWCRPVNGTWMICRFKGVYALLTFYDPTNNGGYRPAVMELKYVVLRVCETRLFTLRQAFDSRPWVPWTID